MRHLEINDLGEDLELDRQAMQALLGSGIWGSVKKFARKTGRYVSRRVKRQIRLYRQVYDSTRSTGRGIYHAAKNGFYLW